jgi:rhodanese-related sulfurtransferase
MVLGSPGGGQRELSAPELAAKLHEGSAIVIDVREAAEFEGGHIPGAINLPLSSFDPGRLPDRQGRMLVLNCAGGKRSAIALEQCAAAQAAARTHLAGGIGAWEAAGLPIEF